MGSREASGLGSSGFHSTLFVSRLCLFCFRCPCTQNWLFCHPVFLPFVLVSTIPLTVSTHLSILNLLLFPPNPCCNKQASSSQYWIGLVNISLPRAMEDVVWSLKNWKLCMEQDCFITACKDPCGIASTVGCRPCARGALIPRWRERERALCLLRTLSYVFQSCPVTGGCYAIGEWIEGCRHPLVQGSKERRDPRVHMYLCIYRTKATLYVQKDG